MTITEFLEARIAEDETVARAASPGPWGWAGEPSEDEAFLYDATGGSVLSAYGMHTTGYLECSEADATHIARYSSDRVLAECAAKRAIVKEHPMTIALWWPEQCEIEVCEKCGDGTDIEYPCPTVKALTGVYASHPDYQQEWAL